MEKVRVEPIPETLPITDRVSRVLELTPQLPVHAQVSLIRRVSIYILYTRSEKESPESFQPISDLMTPYITRLKEAFLEEGNTEGLIILSHRTDSLFYDFHEVNPIFEHVGNALEVAGEKHDDIDALWLAGDTYGRLHLYQDLFRVTDKLIRIGKETGRSEALHAAGMLLCNKRETFERGLELLLEIGKDETAYNLMTDKMREVLYDFKVNRSLKEKIKKRWRHQEALKGKASGSSQFEAWIKERNPLRAIEALLSDDHLWDYDYISKTSVEKVLEAVQEYKVPTEEIQQILRGLKPAGATQKARLLEMSPDFINELAEKSLRCSDKQIATTKERIEIIEAQIDSASDAKERKGLERELISQRNRLASMYLEREMPIEAADCLMEIDPERAKKILEDQLQQAVQKEGYLEAIKLAQKLGRTRYQIELLFKNGQVETAINQCLRHDYLVIAVTAITIDKKDLPTIEYSTLESLELLLERLLEQEKQIKEASAAINQLALHLKENYERRGDFGKAAKMCQLLGEDNLVKVYSEIAELLPIAKIEIY